MLTVALFVGSGVFIRLIAIVGAPLLNDDSIPLFVEIGVAMTVFAAVGGVIASQRPDNAIGWIFGAAAVLVGVRSISDVWAQYGYDVAGGFPGSVFASWLSSWVWIPAMGIVGTFLFLLFPDGRPPSARWRPVAWVGSAGIVAAVASVALAPGPNEEFLYFNNPIAIAKSAAGLVDVFAIGFLLIPLAGAAGVASLIVRIRRSTPIEREQIKWIGFAALFFAVGLAVAVTDVLPFNTLGGLTVFGPLTAVALACGAAIQRYRLFDIDRIISRTVSYALVVAALAAVFTVVVLVPTAVLGLGSKGTPDYLVAAATIAAAAMFRPLLHRFRTAVDHRFNRARYDASQTIEAFGSRLREHVDLDSLKSELEGVVARTMQPDLVFLWLRGPSP